MNPDKVKTMGFIALGVWVLLAGGLGYLAYDAVSSRTEAEETLEEENAAFLKAQMENTPKYEAVHDGGEVKTPITPAEIPMIF